MPEYLTPGVYIEEIERGPRPIEGVPTSTAAFLGETERGSIKPRLVTSYKEYQRWYGGTFGDSKFMPYTVSGFFENGGKRLYVCRIVGENATPAEATFGQFLVRASGAGSWGKRVWARIDDSTTKRPDAGGTPVAVGFRLRFAFWANPPANFQPFDPIAEPLRLPRPSLSEDFDDLVTDASSPDYWQKRMRDSSALAMLVPVPPAGPDARPANGSSALSQAGADDPAPLDVADYKGDLVPGAPRAELQGLAALELDPFREVSLVYAPAADTDTTVAIIDHCERMRFRFAAVDVSKGASNAGGLDPRTNVKDSSYAAFYYPWISMSDPQTGARKTVPPGGHVLGVYARTDVERGVFKAPANETVRGALELEFDINDRTQEVLNPRGVNAVRQFPGRGIRIWGARTLSSNPLWKYVSVRRLFIFLERSIYEGTQWVVFEPNDIQLWDRVTDTLRLFLRSQWRQGALFGRTEEQAFFVTCNESTMTQDDILNGRLICEIGIAPVRPAEFVVFRIFQNTAEAQR
ncbi:phage tail sheath family protein [Burkholderia sp. LMU1-1-1.1]|uniref:phage tail sheath family protein n=1 Tax=Burkholderia sp. LMU1-1-1.1 TaxID=3135266 RepID=UPI00341B55D8